MKAASKRVHVPELDFDEPDREIIYILDHFYEVKQAAGVKISYTELKNYSEIMAFNLQPFENELIMRIDGIFEASING